MVYVQTTPNQVSGSDSPMFADGLMTAVARNTNDMRVNATCDTYDAVASSTLLSGTALVESVAGDCYSFSMELYDKCGAKKRFGGDNVTAHVIGPLHLHKELQRLHVGSGVQDMGDGSYMATTTLTLSGYYVVRVYVNGEFAAESETGYVHPAETSMAHSFVYDVEDAVIYNEVVEAPAGVPVSMKIQTVDRFGNLRTTGCDDGWVMKATGPSNFDGSVSDNGDGTYTVSYRADIAGPYKYTITRDGENICQWGGYTCAAGTQSGTKACTLGYAAGEDCAFCLTVFEGTSLNTTSGLYATVPDASEIALDGSFAATAWVHKTAGDATNVRQYVFSKQSPSSGKGVWLAMEATEDAGTYVIEAAVYTGAKKGWRHARATVAIALDAWSLVGMSYSGTELSILASPSGGALEIVESTKYDSEEFGRRNSQPLRVGAGLMGRVDDFRLYDGIPSEVTSLESNAFCPAKVPSLVLHLRLNEGNGYATKDAVGDNDAVIGLVYGSTTEGGKVKLTCPAGHVITDVLFASFGVTDGAGGAYVVDGCSSGNSMEVVTASCMGKATCELKASKATFGKDPCPGTGKSLTISAACGGGMSAWGETPQAAPTLVGVLDVTKSIEPTCTGLPPYMQAMLDDGSCSTAFEPEVNQEVSFGVLRVDGCGFPDLTARDSFVSSVVYPEEMVATADDANTCLPRSVLAEADAVQVTWGGDSAEYCGVFNNAFVFTYAPHKVGTDAKVHIELGGATVMEKALNVKPLSASPKSTSACATSAESGVMTVISVELIDTHGNAIDVPTAKDSASIDIKAFGNTGSFVVPTLLSTSGGVFTYGMTYPTDGDYTLTVRVAGEFAEGCGNAMVQVSAPEMHSLLHASSVDAEEPRSRHVSVEYDGDFYLFGGVTDSEYLSSTIKYSTGVVEAVSEAYAYATPVVVAGAEISAMTAVEVVVDTASLIASGKMRPDCADMAFVDDGAVMPFWIDPLPGCGSSNTTAWVGVSKAGTYHMVHGSATATSLQADPSSFMTFYDSFERDGVFQDGSLWKLLDSECRPTTFTAAAGAFTTSGVVSTSGTKSLMADTFTADGGSLVAKVGLGTSYVLRAHLFDSGCDGAHWISPTVNACSALTMDKAALDRQIGCGIYTGSMKDVYTKMYPWLGTSVKRSSGWHSVEFSSDGTTVVTRIDGVEVDARGVEGSLDEIFLHSGLFTGNEEAPGYWDAIYAVPRVVGLSVNLVVEETKPVHYVVGAGWSEVVTPTSPPARASAAGCEVNGKWIVSGGERNGFFFSDVWQLDFKKGSWSHAPTFGVGPSGRHSHAIAEKDGVLYLSAGKGADGEVLKDFWSLDLKTMTWTDHSATVPKSMMPRFGHHSAVVGNALYVYGGFVSFLPSQELWEFNFASMQWRLIAPNQLTVKSGLGGDAPMYADKDYVPLFDNTMGRIALLANGFASDADRTGAYSSDVDVVGSSCSMSAVLATNSERIGLRCYDDDGSVATAYGSKLAVLKGAKGDYVVYVVASEPLKGLPMSTAY